MLFYLSQGRCLYAGLFFIRVGFALLGTGYIHPDEYFQNGEAIAGRQLGLHTSLTWEWDSVFPCRSIVPVWMSTGLPFSILRQLLQGQLLSPRSVFVAERLSFLLSSLLLARLQALILLASSYVVLTYQVRPFSNSLEAIQVALSLVLLRQLFVLEKAPRQSQRARFFLSLLALTAVWALFTRVTFAAFFFPVALEVLKWCLRQSRFSLRSLAHLLSLPLLLTLAASLGFIYADSVYFHGSALPPSTELTPLNFLRYNLLPSNLAEHGLHPRWLHLVVNLPMIATPGLLYYVLRAEFDIFTSRSGEKDKAKPGVSQMMQRNVNNGRILRARKPFLIFWIVANTLLAILFGFFHQGGVVPSLFRVHGIVYDEISGLSAHDYRIVYWKTYMPPRHLLAIRREDVDSGRVSVQDVSGASSGSLVATLLASAPSSKPLSTLVVAPFHAVSELDKQMQECISERQRVFPHLDLDHIGESMEVGWRDGLSLGIFDVDVPCLREAVQLQEQWLAEPAQRS
ncbi:hypothetical protein OH77DRAFT_1294558 [Trametes cingulata]|nr:hypothetical protein OH77DRAFT_1294558 [Trametes cingulata]